MVNQAWYKQNLQISIPVSIVAGVIALIILFSLLRCLKRCCCGRSKPKVIAGPLMTAAAIPPNVPGQRIPSWSRLPNNGYNSYSERRAGDRDSAQPLMYNSVAPNWRRSEDNAHGPFPNPFDPPPERISPQPRGRLRSPQPSPGSLYPATPAAPLQPTWTGSTGGPGMAGVGSGRTGWVDDRLYNGSRS